MTFKVAIPTTNGEVNKYLKSCDYFTFFSINDGKISNKEKYTVPEEYRNNAKIALILNEKGVKILLADKIEYDAFEDLFNHGIDVICYCIGDINEAVEMYLKGELSALEINKKSI